MKRLFVIFTLLLTLSFSTQNYAKVKYLEDPVFNDGEHAVYNIYYNWGWIWIHAGNVEFTVKKQNIKGRECYNLFVSGYTRKTFDKMYTIRDTFASYIYADNLSPFYYKEVKHEDSYYCNKQYVYKQDGNKNNVYLDFVRYTKHWKDTLQIDINSVDLVTTCYKFRNIDNTVLNRDELIPFSMLFDDEVFSLGLKYKGKEKIKLKNGKSYNALKFVPKLITGDLFKNEDDMTIYVTDDENHVPLLITAKIKVGSIKAMLNSVQNTKKPISSLQK